MYRQLSILLELLIWVSAYLDLKYKIEPCAWGYDLEHIVDTAYLWIGGLSISMWLNLALAVVLFICLWKKEPNLTPTCKNNSPEKERIPPDAECMSTATMVIVSLIKGE